MNNIPILGKIYNLYQEGSMALLPKFYSSFAFFLRERYNINS